MPVDTRLVDAAQHILETLADGLTDAGISVPDRQYVHTGQIAYDLAGASCAEAFVVSWQASFPGSLGSEADDINVIRCSMPLSVQFSVELLRCVPTLTPKVPTAAALDAAGGSLMEDAWTLNRVIVDKTIDGTLRQLPIAQVALGGSSAIGPGGGVGGVAVTLLVGIL